MARRKQKHLVEPQTLLGLILAAGVLWLAAQALHNLPNLGNLLMLVAAIAAVAVCARLARRAMVRQALFRKARVVTQQRTPALVRRRTQLVRADPYGKPNESNWTKEVDYFISHHIRPLLTSNEESVLATHHQEVSAMITKLVEGAMRQQPAFGSFSDDMKPAEFETFCAEELRRAGWNSRVTLQSRDQGVDVVAEKDGVRVVLQCKLYARPVGNRCVQEAAAARAHEKAHYGIVVTNNRYTEAAEQLATTNGILLLHYRDLHELERIIQQHANASALTASGQLSAHSSTSKIKSGSP